MDGTDVSDQFFFVPEFGVFSLLRFGVFGIANRATVTKSFFIGIAEVL